MTPQQILPSRNEDDGFFGTLTRSPLRDRRTADVWILASTLIAGVSKATSEEEWIGICNFLDSRMGRHFADDVVGALQCGVPDCETAIHAAIRKWQGWRISPRTEREDGIPAGLAYLTGWVQFFAVAAAMNEAD